MIRSGRALAIIVVVFVLILAPGASASAGPGENPQTREGFWIGFGLGYGSADRSCDRAACQQDRVGSVTGFLKLGGTLNPRVLAGVEANVWSKKEEGVSNVLGALSATATFYPFGSSGFFVKGGVGLSYASRETRTGTRLDLPVDATIKFTGVGAGVLAGLGYDLRVAHNISITPTVTYYYGATGTAEANELIVPGTSHNVLDLALGLTFH